MKSKYSFRQKREKLQLPSDELGEELERALRHVAGDHVVGVPGAQFSTLLKCQGRSCTLLVLQGDWPVTSIPILCCIEFGSSPGRVVTSAASYCPRRLGNFRNWCQQNIGIEVTGHPVCTYKLSLINDNECIRKMVMPTMILRGPLLGQN